MKLLATLAILSSLVATPAVADSDKHRGYDGYDRYNRGQIVAACNHHANARGLRGHERREFVEWCTDRGRYYASLDRDRYRDYWYRQRERERYYDQYYGRRFDPYYERDYAWYRDEWRYRNDWRYGILREVVLAELRRDWDD
jgi:hypothetical protein